MLDRLIDFAVRRRVATLIGALAFAIFGVLTFRHLKIEAFPDVTNVQVMVITLFPGQAAEEVEKRVTIPLERALTGTPRVLIQRSITSFGLSQVILTFEDDVDIYWARQQVAERLPDADMPDGITPRLGPNDTPVGQIYQYTLESDRHSPSELRSWQDWVVSKHLMRTPGVADVVSFGGFQKEYHVLANPGRLRNAGVTLDDLVDAVAGSNGATSGGYLRQGESEAVVRAQGYLRTPRDIRNTVIKATSGTPVLVRNVADVVEAYTPLRGAVARGGARDSIEGTILLRRGENPRDVLDGVHQTVARINRDILPPGMRIVPFYDRTRLVDTTLETVSHNMIEGVVLVSLVLWLFLRAVSGSIAVAITMPLALLTAFVGLHFSGVPANLLSMGAIDFGILLDGAVILVENAYRRLAEERPAPEDVASTVAHARQGGRAPDTVLDVDHRRRDDADLHARARRGPHLPPRRADVRVRAAGRAVLHDDRRPGADRGIAEAPHGVRARAGVPALAARALSDRVADARCATRSARQSPASACWRWRCRWCPRLGAEFLPEMNEGDIHVTVTMPSAVSLDRGAEVLRETRLALLSFQEVKDVLTEQGHPEDGTDDEAPNQAETFVIMKPEREWKTGRSKEQIVDLMRAASSGVPASSTTSASRSRIASRNRSPASAARWW